MDENRFEELAAELDRELAAAGGLTKAARRRMEQDDLAADLASVKRLEQGGVVPPEKQKDYEKFERQLARMTEVFVRDLIRKKLADETMPISKLLEILEEYQINKGGEK